MPLQQFKFTCYSCKGETKVTFSVPSQSSHKSINQEQMVDVTRVCVHCGRSSVLRVPRSWDNYSPPGFR